MIIYLSKKRVIRVFKLKKCSQCLNVNCVKGEAYVREGLL